MMTPADAREPDLATAADAATVLAQAPVEVDQPVRAGPR